MAYGNAARAGAALASLTLALVAACSSPEESSGPVTSPPSQSDAAAAAAPTDSAVAVNDTAAAEAPESPSASAQLLIDRWHAAVSASTGVWPGYELAAIPAVLVSIDRAGAVSAVVAFNHPNPVPLGSPILRLDVGGHEVAVIAEPTDPDALFAMAPFDFYADIGGTATFVLIGQQGDLGTEPDSPAFSALLAHETFHRFQFDNWSEDAAVHSLEGYDLSPAGIELVLLEDRILISAYEAASAAEAERLARQFTAVRAARHAASPSVGLDEQQERIEGSARYLEHLIGDALDGTYTSTNHAGELMFYDDMDADAAAQLDGITSFFGFGRFYSSGATLLSLAHRLGAPIDDIASRLSDSTTPAQMLEQLVEPVGEIGDEVDAAWAEHDSEGRLRAVAAILAERALQEDSSGFGTETPMGSFDVSDEQIDCLTEHGIDITADNFTIPDDIAQACFNDDRGE
ncbi:hypothetical protein [Candidatus Poriferisodalis sp.]|uniref:hypothetical protein n=1 Tax=Candidatus Poriferisodalis sp. TaxID=3101277 RepID=UPI003B0293A9